MKKKYIIILICFLLSGCSFKNESIKYIKKSIGLDISSCNIIEDENTHGGFLGDGTYFIKAKCNKDIIKQVSSWKELPLSNNLKIALYGTESNNEMANENKYQLTEKIPKIENGYYYFIDRYTDYENKEDDSEIFNRYSFNFTITIYDIDTNTLYYYEIDT